jgi:hypothetical protein
MITKTTPVRGNMVPPGLLAGQEDSIAMQSGFEASKFRGFPGARRRPGRTNEALSNIEQG